VIIVRCSHCRGLMKVDDGRLPADKPGRVRCPHCDRICPADPRQDLSDQLRTTSEAALEDTEGARVPPAESEKTAPQSAPGTVKRPSTVSQPAEDDNDFVFPAEQGGRRSRERSLSTGGRVILLTVLSLFVMAFFALVVNVLLPGPPKSSLATGIGRNQKPPAKAIDSDVRYDRRTSGGVSDSPGR
jgi:predicted Zn finger-like uncharacterized protein